MSLLAVLHACRCHIAGRLTGGLQAGSLGCDGAYNIEPTSWLMAAASPAMQCSLASRRAYRVQSRCSFADITSLCHRSSVGCGVMALQCHQKDGCASPDVRAQGIVVVAIFNVFVEPSLL
ncbi:hypothetical protein GUJ93_ZPchr0008g11871 [Zizania palustris]|uniref:Uncharacterized protein n=1 Tax=Zizania palustris TaxID=103762 RepID=A0A8J5VK94_ZIZPA|nr:hypothetical protein GUJ93_ZPchr0008g11871 [Zizania palustris]